jgi:hypothetical protein
MMRALLLAALPLLSSAGSFFEMVSVRLRTLTPYTHKLELHAFTGAWVLSHH